MKYSYPNQPYKGLIKTEKTEKAGSQYPLSAGVGRPNGTQGICMLAASTAIKQARGEGLTWFCFDPQTNATNKIRKFKAHYQNGFPSKTHNSILLFATKIHLFMYWILTFSSFFFSSGYDPSSETSHLISLAFVQSLLLFLIREIKIMGDIWSMQSHDDSSM